MNRQLLQDLLLWKAKSRRKPLLIDGARQTGKTYLLRQLLGQSFARVLHIDFLEQPNLAKAFDGSLEPAMVLQELALLTGQRFDPQHDLLILDEIGECPRAVTALKYFAEKQGGAYIAASGSNIGLLSSFPVGKVEQHILRPLTFQEFIWAEDDPDVRVAYDGKADSAATHQRLWGLLTDYLFTGGMPEAVATWKEQAGANILDRIAAIEQVHRNLVQGYQRDFGKYSGKANAQLIGAVFQAVPAQLSVTLDASVNRYQFNRVMAGKNRYTDLAGPMDWLHCTRLILKNHLIEGQATAPLAANFRQNFVKLFMFDVGILNHMLGSSYQAIKAQNYAYKGYIAENFVQQELAALGLEPSASWKSARAEIEFLLCDTMGRVIPLEVKSGTRTRAKSLQAYIEKSNPHRTIKLTGTRGSAPAERQHLVRPLYYAGHLREWL